MNGDSAWRSLIRSSFIAFIALFAGLLGEFFIPGSMLPFTEHPVGLFPDLGTIGPLNIAHDNAAAHSGTSFGGVSLSANSETALNRGDTAFADRAADHVHSVYATRGSRDTLADSHSDSAFPFSRTAAAPAGGMGGGYGQTGQGMGMQRGGGMGMGMGMGARPGMGMQQPGGMGMQPGGMGMQQGGMGMQQQGGMGMNGGPQMPMNPNAPIVFLVPTKGVGGFGGVPKMIQLPSLYSLDVQMLTLASTRNHNFRNMGNYFF